MKKLLSCIISLLLIITSVFVPGMIQPVNAVSTLQVHVIDVGQADSIYIKLPNGQNMLIDGGNNADGTAVVNYLKGQGVTKVDYVVGTHPHEDHIGGLDDVINSFTIGKIYMPNKSTTTTTYTDLLNAIKAKRLTVTSAAAGMSILNTTVDSKTLSAVILSPKSTTASYTDINDYSVVIRLVFGSSSILLTGDAGSVPEQEMINSGRTMSANILKVGHHGSSTASTDAFLTKVNPSMAVISVGVNNTYGHPDQATIDRLKAHNISIYRTDMQGAIIYTSTGTSFTANVNPWWKSSSTGSTGSTDSTGTVASGIVINEILSAPSTAYTNEWVELYNPGSSSVDIGGYIIDDIAGGGGAPYTIPSGTVIPAGGYWLWKTSGYFNNSGDDVRLLNASGVEIDKYTYGASSYDKSWCRIPSGGDWQATEDPTPTMGAANN